MIMQETGQGRRRQSEEEGKMRGGRDEKVASSKRKTKLKTKVQKSIPYL